MKVAVFGRKFDKSFEASLGVFFEKLCNLNCEILFFEPFYNFLTTNSSLNLCQPKLFNSHKEITSDINFFFSLGGDGTILEAVRYVRDAGIPIIGINTGKLGFLANIAQEEIEHSLTYLFSGNYEIEERSLISCISPCEIFDDFPFGLNEVTIQKRDTSLITIETEINGNYLSTYRTDGLIISTPTGSTAYSMSVGGPIVAPDCRTLIISPIASHNLTVRPIVVSDNLVLKFKISSVSKCFMLTIDSRFKELSTENILEIRLSDYRIKMVRLPNHSFYHTIRKKLMWGVDVRN
jgi:NAD+ kinase